MTKNSSQKKDNDNISISDLAIWQNSLKKDIDFDKPDNELSTEEAAKKAIYQSMDKVIEDSIGKEVKKDIDEKTKLMDELSKFQNNLKRLIEVGKEIERNFVYQSAYLINHFDKSKENKFRLIVDGMTSDAVNQEKQMTNSERMEFAKNILEIIKAYREKVMKELFAKQEIIAALLPTLEKTLNDADFDLYGEKIGNKSDADDMKSRFQEWLKFSKELFSNRKKAIDAVEEQLDMDEIIPEFVVQNSGDITKNMSAVELNIKGERMVRLINEADEVEKRIEEKRLKISEGLFGKIETYLDFGEKNKNDDEELIKYNSLEAKTWYRFAKVIYIGLWIVGLGISAIVASVDGFSYFIWGSIIVWIILTGVKKAFLYIVLGKNQ